MERPRLIVVCGIPGAGKTTLARALGTDLHLPVVVRDDLKTGLASTRGTPEWDDEAGRARLAGDAFDLCYRLIELHLAAGSGLVAEAAFHWDQARAGLADAFAAADVVVVHVTVDPALAVDRYRERHGAGLRHRSHHDDRFVASMADPAYRWDRYWPPPDLGVPVVTIDGSLRPAEVLARALAALPRGPAALPDANLARKSDIDV